MRKCRVIGHVVWLLWCSGVLVVDCASAQSIDPWNNEYEEPLQPDFARDDVRLVEEFLQLSDEQRHAFAAIYERYRAELEVFVTKYAPVRARLDHAVEHARLKKPEQWVAVSVQREEQLAEIADNEAAIEATFIDDLRPLLSPPQEERWHLLQERFRRIKWRGAAYGEERVDLIAIVEQITGHEHLPKGGGDLQDVLRAYSADLDRALQARAKADIHDARNWFRAMEDQMRIEGNRTWIEPPADPETWWNEQEKRGTLHAAVRDVNRRYRSVVAALLPDFSTELDRLYYRTALGDWRVEWMLFPVYLDRVRDTPNKLTPEQVSALDAMAARYNTEAKHRNDAILRAEEARVDLQHQRHDDPNVHRQAVRKLELSWEHRRDLEVELIAELTSLLTPEQREAVGPAPEVKPG